MIQTIKSLSEVWDAYDAILCDVWGVIHNGQVPFDEAVSCLEQFRAARGPVLMLSNSPRPSPRLVEQFEDIGIRPTAYDLTLTSGDATLAALETRRDRTVFYIGPGRDGGLLTGHSVTDNPEEADLVLCTGPFNDDVETAADYQELVAQLLRSKPEFICANPDHVVQRGDRLITCAGAIAYLYEQQGGPVLYEGKPHKPVYELAVQQLSERLGKPLDKKRILAIGDGPQTDVKGALDFGVDCLYVATGIHAAEIIDGKGNLIAQKLNDLFPDGEKQPSYAMAALANE